MDLSKISDHNMLIYERYTNKAASDGASLITIKNMQNTVLPFLIWLGDINVEDVTEDKIYAYFRHLNEYQYKKKGKDTKYSDQTKYNIKAYIKKFLGKYNPATSATIENHKTKKTKLPEDILTETEIKRLLDVCLSERDKAVISVLYETGMRRSEFLSLKIKNIEFDAYGAVITIPEKGSKTGARRNRVVYCVSYLHAWLSVHPRKNDREAPLFCSMHSPYGLTTKTGLADQLLLLAKRAGIQKRVTPHLFRHSRATHLTKFMTEQQMKQFLGWTAGSNMAAVYVHLSGKEIDGAILKHYGVPTDEADSKDPFAVKICLRCKEIVPEGEEWCLKCGYSEKDPIFGKAEYDEIMLELELAKEVKQHEIEMAVQAQMAEVSRKLDQQLDYMRRSLKEKEPEDVGKS